MNPAHDGDRVVEVAGKVAAMNGFVMCRTIAHDHQVLQATFHLPASQP